MKKIMLFSILFLLIAATNIQIHRNNVIVRKGPGIFFEKLGELQKNESLVMNKKVEKWIEIDYNSEIGFISENSITAGQNNDDIFKKLGTQKTDLVISKHGISAGVKGFAARTNRSQENIESFENYYNNYNLTNKYYQRFRRKSPKKFKKVDIPNPVSHTSFSQAESRFGMAIAKQIVNFGIYNNLELQNYINSVGMKIVESTEMYDQLFKFFILDTNKVNAYACPGGIIFITKGLLESLENEAELSVILAHEITHCIRQHGMKEAKNRKTLIAAENTFSELDSEMDDLGIEQDAEIRAVEEELENDLMDFYDTVFDGRLMEYEYEADFYATVYAARAGYKSDVLIDILDRLVAKNSQSTNEHYTMTQLTTRKNEIIEKGLVQVNSNKLKLMPERFKNMMRLMQ